MPQLRLINPLYILVGIILAILVIFGIIELQEYYEKREQEENIAAGVRRLYESG